MKKLLVLLAAASVVLAATGCQSPPDLTPDAGAAHKLGSANGAPGPGTAVTLTADAQSQVLVTGQFGQMKTAVVGVTSGGDGSAWSGSVLFQGSVDGVNWYALPCNMLNVDAGTESTNLVQSYTGVNGVWSCNVLGLYEFEAQGVVIGDGSANVTVNLASDLTPVTYSVVDAATGLLIRTSY
jgi:hypothetical protein